MILHEIQILALSGWRRVIRLEELKFGTDRSEPTPTRGSGCGGSARRAAAQLRAEWGSAYCYKYPCTLLLVVAFAFGTAEQHQEQQQRVEGFIQEELDIALKEMEKNDHVRKGVKAKTFLAGSCRKGHFHREPLRKRKRTTTKLDRLVLFLLSKRVELMNRDVASGFVASKLVGPAWSP